MHISEIILLKEAVATTAIEKGWDEEKQKEVLDKALQIAVESYYAKLREQK